MEAVDNAAVGGLVAVVAPGAAAAELGDAADERVAVADDAADADEAVEELLVAGVGLEVFRRESVGVAEGLALLELGDLVAEEGAGEEAAVGGRLADDGAVLLVVAAVARVGDDDVGAVGGDERLE